MDMLYNLFSYFWGTSDSNVNDDGRETPTELLIETTHMPEGVTDDSPRTKTGDKIRVHYTGILFSNRKQFDSSVDRNRPLPLTLGVGQVIPGWDEGLQGMVLHERRTLTIPAHLAYGSRVVGRLIPANSALVFSVELVGLEST